MNHRRSKPRIALPLVVVTLIAVSVAGCSDELGAPSSDTDVGSTDVGTDAANGDATAEDTDASDADGSDAEDTGASDTPADGTIDTDVDAGPEPVEVTVEPECENLNPRFCILPFPSDRWLAEDADTVTGYSLALDGDAVPRPATNAPFDPTPFARLDGFSGSTQIITLFDEPVDVSGLAGFDSIERSLQADHPTQLIDLTTGEPVAHWVENDARADSPGETLFYLRPVTRLEPDHAYGIALRDLRGSTGAPLTADPIFAALRDGVPTTSPQIEARRAKFESLFTALEDAGIERSDLVQAWQFHTASDESVRSRMIAMRDDAIERLGDDGLGCSVTEVEENFRDTGARRVHGTVTVPWYLDAPRAPATFVYDDDGDPAYQGTEEIGFTAIVPPSRLEDSGQGPLVTWGHGLFGSAEGSISGTDVIGVADAFGAVVVGTDWHGMSSNDLPFLATALSNVSNFYMLGENLQQGMVNFIALTRTMLGACRSLPAFEGADSAPAIDPTTNFFVGGSQGSILGTTLLTLSPDTHRGMLIVGGASFSFMIERSIHFTRFGALLDPYYDSRLAIGTLMVMSQSVWDDAETAAWIGITAEGSEDTEPKDYVYLIAENDAQVANLSSDIAIRTAGIPVMAGSARTPWGIPLQEAPYTGSAYLSMGTWDAEPAGGNVSPTVDDGGHGLVGFTEPAVTLTEHFFDTGEVIVPCAPACGEVGTR